MPIGPFENFQALRSKLREERKKSGKKALPPERQNAETAAVAERIRPGWHKEAAKARK